MTVGAAKVSLGRIVAYDWGKLRDIWMTDDSPTLADFCRRWHIPYSVAHGTGNFSQTRKAAVTAVVKNGFMTGIVRRLMVVRAAEADAEAGRVMRIIDRLEAVAERVTAFSAARLAKLSGGEEVVNVELSPSEVLKLTNIAEGATRVLRDLVEMRANADPGDLDGDDLDIGVEGPAPVTSPDDKEPDHADRPPPGKENPAAPG